jgi:hypothetical protein
VKWSDLCTYYPSKAGTPVAAYVHPLGHTVPTEVPAMVMRFFKELPQK